MKEPAHILIVDDDDRIRDLTKRFLTMNGFRVSGAADAAAARRLMESMAFDLAILDIMMPGEDGLSLLSGIRKGPSRETPVMLLTARGLTSDRIEGLRLGADDYLAKPFEPEELVLRCEAILRRSQKSAPPPDEIEMSGLLFNAAGLERSVDVQVTRLRRKIEPNPKEPVHIQTVRGIGYRLMPD